MTTRGNTTGSSAMILVTLNLCIYLNLVIMYSNNRYNTGIFLCVQYLELEKETNVLGRYHYYNEVILRHCSSSFSNACYKYCTTRKYALLIISTSLLTSLRDILVPAMNFTVNGARQPITSVKFSTSFTFNPSLHNLTGLLASGTLYFNVYTLQASDCAVNDH